MSLADVVRERACPCAWCGRPTWNLNAVCKSKLCRERERRYRIRRESIRQDSRGSHMGGIPPAAGPRDDAAAGHLAVPASPGAAFSDGERAGLPVTARASSEALSPSGPDRDR